MQIIEKTLKHPDGVVWEEVGVGGSWDRISPGFRVLLAFCLRNPPANKGLESA
jgi:hypothetical protein